MIEKGTVNVANTKYGGNNTLFQFLDTFCGIFRNLFIFLRVLGMISHHDEDP